MQPTSAAKTPLILLHFMVLLLLLVLPESAALPALLLATTAIAAFVAACLYSRLSLWVPAVYGFAVPFTTTVILLPLHPRFELLRGPQTLGILMLGGLLLAACAFVGAGLGVYLRMRRISKSQVALHSLKYEFGVVEKTVGAFVGVVKLLQTVIDVTATLSGKPLPLLLGFLLGGRLLQAQEANHCTTATAVGTIVVVLDQITPRGAPSLPTSPPFVDILHPDPSSPLRRLPDIVNNEFVIPMQPETTLRAGLIRPVRDGSVFKNETFIVQPRRMGDGRLECVGIVRFRELPSWSMLVESSPADLLVLQVTPQQLKGRTGQRPLRTGTASWEEPISLRIYEIGDGLYFQTSPHPTDFREDLTIRYDNQAIKERICETPRGKTEKRGRCSWFWQLLIDATKTPESVTLRRTL